jgi:hypothetical protein
MYAIHLYPLEPLQRVLLAATVSSTPPLLADRSPPADDYVSPLKPAKLITDFEDHRNHGIGD